MTDESLPARRLSSRWTRPPLGRWTPEILFVIASVLLCAWPLIPQLFGGGKHKDYVLWYLVGRAVLTGGPLYSIGGQGFAFLYPPFAAILLAPFSLFGRAFSIFCLCLVNVASWWTACKLSERLSGVPGDKPWWVLVLPSMLAAPFIYDMFDLGQPNLMLLAIMLAGLAFLQARRQWAAGTMFAAAVALKAFPIAIFPYLLWRRRWWAALSMVVMTLVFLFVVPAPFRGFERNAAEVKTWASGMVLSAGEKGFGQRPEQNWGWKNNSLIAITHRYLRPINAEAEHPEWKPFSVNFLNLTYDQANLVLLAAAGLIGLGFVAVLPPERRRTPASDAAEYGLLLALMIIASPLARAYYFVWLLFPFTVLVQRATMDPDPAVRRRVTWLLGAALGLFVLGIPVGPPHVLLALGILFWADAVIVGAMVWLMRHDMKPASSQPA